MAYLDEKYDLLSGKLVEKDVLLSSVFIGDMDG